MTGRASVMRQGKNGARLYSDPRLFDARRDAEYQLVPWPACNGSPWWHGDPLRTGDIQPR
jgi:hypothetical protein